MEDIAELRVSTFEEARDRLDDLARRLGVVEVELVVGEEPEEGVEVACSPRPLDFGAARVLRRDDGTEEPLRYYAYGHYVDTARKVRSVELLEKDGVICVPVGISRGLPQPPRVVIFDCKCAGLPPEELCAACAAALKEMGAPR